MPRLTEEQIQAIVAAARPERLSDPGKRPIPEDHVAHIVQLARWGHAGLAADHLLFPEIGGSLPSVVGGVIRELGLRVAWTPGPVEHGPAAEELVRTRRFAYETLLEIALNFTGLESRWLPEDEKRRAVESIRHALAEWEVQEAAEGPATVAAAVVRHFLGRLKLVQKGAAMVAQSAVRIEKMLDFRKPVLLTFLDEAFREITQNIYTRLVRDGICRFGNDYALGLRWLRHLGFEQVSTNPVLAALAYQDDPGLRGAFQVDVRMHPMFAAWSRNPQQSSDAIALYATLGALWDNLHVYRPIFFNLAQESGGGVVSFQLNPNIAHRVRESVDDAFAAADAVAENLRVYDGYLLAGYPTVRERARPNMVIKVAASPPAAREIARTINRFGLGSNITLVYAAAQEVTMILEELAGMAGAVRKGILPTQLYMTNMGGRFESHLREVTLEALFGQLRSTLGESAALARVEQLAASNGSKAAVDRVPGYEAKVVAATRYAAQRKIDGNVSAALAGVASDEELKTWEDAIGRSGTLVARRVWTLFFSPKNWEKWVAYLCRRHELARDDATLILGRICYLPASKRKPEDTYWALATANMVHTEFPNHQENVRRMAESDGFRIADYRESITGEFPAQIVEVLNRIPDFRHGYELNPELNAILQEAGITGDFGTGGLAPDQWPEFGPVQKTLAEFKGAYDTFRDDVLKLFAEVAAPQPLTGPVAARGEKADVRRAG
ncbi:MAG TPA: hypothetical protein VI007_11750 [bacterium]